MLLFREVKLAFQGKGNLNVRLSQHFRDNLSNVLGMTWDEDPLCSSLVHQYLQARHPSLATEFSSTHNPPQCVFPLQDVLRKWEEIQLVRSLVQQHLEKVAPSLVQDFRLPDLGENPSQVEV